MFSRMTTSERRAFNNGLQVALLAICLEYIPACSSGAKDVCRGCAKLPKKQKQVFDRIKTLQDRP